MPSGKPKDGHRHCFPFIYNPFLVHKFQSHDAPNMYIGDYAYLISEASRTSIQDTVALRKGSSYHLKLL